MPTERVLVVHPTLHSSGFGNQVGMLLQHVAVAALGWRTLIVPPIHQPAEHRRNNDDDSSLAADEAFNLSAFAPLVRVLSARQAHQEAALLRSSGELTFSLIDGDSSRPVQLQPGPMPAVLAAIYLMRTKGACERNSASAGGRSCNVIGYCHTVSCRTRTRRACRRLQKGCSRSAQRLPNNYLFAHRLPPLVCEPVEAEDDAKAASVGVQSAASLRAARAIEATEVTEASVLDVQRRALHLLQLGDAVRHRSAALARRLGQYACVHSRMADVSDPSSKGMRPAELPARIGRLVRQLQPPQCEGQEGARAVPSLAATAATVGGPWTLYVASNRPRVVSRLKGAIDAAVRDAVGSRPGWGRCSVTVRAWDDLLPHVDVSAGEAWRQGLRAALIEHELCTTAPLGFAGGQFSTWSNLIGVRRYAMGVPASRAYLDVEGGAAVADCKRWAARRSRKDNETRKVGASMEE